MSDPSAERADQNVSETPNQTADQTADQAMGRTTAETAAETDTGFPTRAVVTWAVIGALLLGAFFSAVGALNRDVYGPRGLVTAYLGDLASRNADAALALPGVDLSPSDLSSAGLPTGTSRELLRADALGGLSDFHVTNEQDLGGNRHRVDAEYRLGRATHTSTFVLERTGSYLGLFGAWRFAVSPIAIARVSVLHADTFSVNGLHLNPTATEAEQESEFSASADYLVFTPARYDFGHASELLEAKPLDVAITEGSQINPVTVDVEANGVFRKKVRSELIDFLDACAKQQVLQPTGCPFGTEVDDRLVSPPDWSIATYPAVTVVPGATGWRMPSIGGTAHLTVRVQSLFDGTISTLDRDVPFTVGLTITLSGNNITIGVGD